MTSTISSSKWRNTIYNLHLLLFLSHFFLLCILLHLPGSSSPTPSKPHPTPKRAYQQHPSHLGWVCNTSSPASPFPLLRWCSLGTNLPRNRHLQCDNGTFTVEGAGLLHFCNLGQLYRNFECCWKEKGACSTQIALPCLGALKKYLKDRLGGSCYLQTIRKYHGANELTEVFRTEV